MTTTTTTATVAAATVVAITYHYEEGDYKQAREWKLHRPREDRPSPSQLLTGPCNFHFYIDNNDNKKSNHLLKVCRQFKRLQEEYTKMQKSVID
jgi:hypothetical protein